LNELRVCPRIITTHKYKTMIYVKDGNRNSDTCKSIRNLSRELKREGISARYQTVAACLPEPGYSLRSNKKCMTDGARHPDRNAQFEHINEAAGKALKRGNSVIGSGHEEERTDREL
jgi:hypothetical protein